MKSYAYSNVELYETLLLVIILYEPKTHILVFYELGSLPYVCVSGDVNPVDKVLTKGSIDNPQYGVIHRKQMVEHGSHQIQGFWYEYRSLGKIVLFC